MENNLLKKITKLSFTSLALLPLLKENINSVLIIFCLLLTLFYNIKTPQKKVVTKQIWILTLPFWMFFFYQTIRLDFNINQLLRQLPFLVFPLLFSYSPFYINQKVMRISMSVFQISAFLQCAVYFFFFLNNNLITTLFDINNNIPFFREFVTESYFFKIHPTYFSSYLLVSFTISLLRFSHYREKNSIIDYINILWTLFFIFLFSSKIIILLVLATVIAFLLYVIVKKGFRNAFKILIVFLILLGGLFYLSKDIVGNRFKEIKTEFKKPIVGDYYNSINTRVAVIRCCVLLQKKAPFWGYGNKLQEKLNDCYKSTNNSDFYLKHRFNTHNYYLNLLLYGGWVFLILFCLYLFFVYENMSNSILSLFLFFQFLCINLTENYFSRHYGIVSFSYFISMFIFINKRK